VPRVVLALLIGVVVAQPIVLKIFEGEINVELQTVHSERLISYQEQLDKQFDDIPDLEERVARQQEIAAGQARPSVSDDPDVKAAQQVVDEARVAWQNAERTAQCELSGSCGSGQAGQGVQYKEAKRVADEARARLEVAERVLQRVREEAQARIDAEAPALQAAAQSELETLLPLLRERQAARAAALARAEQLELGNNGLLARLDALDRLEERSPVVRVTSLALLLLFASVGLLPVLAELLANARLATLYDELLERAQAKQREIADIDDEVAIELERDRAARQLEVGKRANATLASLQEKLTQQALTSWQEQVRLSQSSEMPLDWSSGNLGRSPSQPPLALPPGMRDVE
jgi:hypothetical protein